MNLNVTFNENVNSFVVDFDENADSFSADFGETQEVVNPYAVLYTPQELTEEQQTQAKTNIGVVDYELPVASDSSLGGVMIGDGLSIDENGVLSADADSDKTFVYEQMSASDVWMVEHDLDKYPSVTVVDSAGSIVVGDVEYNSTNTITLTFTSAFSGTAYLN